MVRISYKDRVTNEEVCDKIQRAIAPHEDLPAIIKRRKLEWYGHESHSSGLARIFLQGTVKGGRRQRRQKKMLEDSIREWAGLEFAKPKRTVENRKKKTPPQKKQKKTTTTTIKTETTTTTTKRRTLVVKSSVVPKGPSRLQYCEGEDLIAQPFCTLQRLPTSQPRFRLP